MNVKTYTIQNGRGDMGFIQWVDENLIAHDEVIGGSYEIEQDWLNCYCVISETEYNMIKQLHESLNEEGQEIYLTALNALIDAVIEKNKKHVLQLKGIDLNEN